MGTWSNTEQQNDRRDWDAKVDAAMTKAREAISTDLEGESFEALAERVGNIVTNTKEIIGEVYKERDRCAAAFAALAAALGWEVYWAWHPAEDKDWDKEWRHILFVETPAGQVSWHFHESEFPLIEKFGFRANKWDGHTTKEKYARLESLMSPDAIKREMVGGSGADCDCGSGWRCEVHSNVKAFEVSPEQMRVLKQSGDWEKIIKGEIAPPNARWR